MKRSSLRRPDGLALAVAACIAVPVQAHDQIITATIDPSDESAARESIGNFMLALPAFPSIVGIDLTILPNADGTHGVLLIASPGGDATAVTCNQDGFGRITGDFVGIRFPALAAYPHIVLEVDLNGQSGRSGLVLSCDYQGASQTPVFRMMGRFLVSKTSIPTAEDVLMVAQPTG
jgi:hypothetical protein